jgi:hypothetical protein
MPCPHNQRRNAKLISLHFYSLQASEHILRLSFGIISEKTHSPLTFTSSSTKGTIRINRFCFILFYLCFGLRPEPRINDSFCSEPRLCPWPKCIRKLHSNIPNSPITKRRATLRTAARSSCIFSHNGSHQGLQLLSNSNPFFLPTPLRTITLFSHIPNNERRNTLLQWEGTNNRRARISTETHMPENCASCGYRSPFHHHHILNSTKKNVANVPQLQSSGLSWKSRQRQRRYLALL